MTREEINNMPAGNEMDELILQKIFGYEKLPIPASPKFQKPTENGTVGKFFIPPYSTDMSAAWEIVEKVISWGNGWCPQIYWDDNDGLEPAEWVAEFNRYWKAENDYRHFEAVADTVPLAICRAALLTTIEEK